LLGSNDADSPELAAEMIAIPPQLINPAMPLELKKAVRKTQPDTL
jgi:hypothetical protein